MQTNTNEKTKWKKSKIRATIWYQMGSCETGFLENTYRWIFLPHQTHKTRGLNIFLLLNIKVRNHEIYSIKQILSTICFNEKSMLHWQNSGHYFLRGKTDNAGFHLWPIRYQQPAVHSLGRNNAVPSPNTAKHWRGFKRFSSIWPNVVDRGWSIDWARDGGTLFFLFASSPKTYFLQFYIYTSGLC